jgi:thiosulfate dehydrogenase
MRQFLSVLTNLAVGFIASGVSFSQETTEVPPINYELAGPLVPAHTTIVTAWDLPRNPLNDSTLDESPLSDQVRLGFRIFMNTPVEASRFSHNQLSCNNCHLNAGQREWALPLVGVSTQFPEYNKRAGRLFSLEDRIVGCFMRSQDAVNRSDDSGDSTQDETATLPAQDSKEVLAVSAYLTWLSSGYAVGDKLPWRGKNFIPEEKLLPLERLSATKGEALFKEKCASCHGDDGQGVQIGDKKAGPLWGPHSWNDGAGAARIYTLAGLIRYTMPYLEPGGLTDEEAQHISCFINSKPRPEYPMKREDYKIEPLPVDAVYYRQ